MIYFQIDEKRPAAIQGLRSGFEGFEDLTQLLETAAEVPAIISEENAPSNILIEKCKEYAKKDSNFFCLVKKSPGSPYIWLLYENGKRYFYQTSKISIFLEFIEKKEDQFINYSNDFYDAQFFDLRELNKNPELECFFENFSSRGRLIGYPVYTTLLLPNGSYAFFYSKWEKGMKVFQILFLPNLNHLEEVILEYVPPNAQFIPLLIAKDITDVALKDYVERYKEALKKEISNKACAIIINNTNKSFPFLLIQSVDEKISLYEINFIINFDIFVRPMFSDYKDLSSYFSEGLPLMAKPQL